MNNLEEIAKAVKAKQEQKVEKENEEKIVDNVVSEAMAGLAAMKGAMSSPLIKMAPTNTTPPTPQQQAQAVLNTVRSKVRNDAQANIQGITSQLKTLRVSQGLTQKQLGLMCGLSASCISSAEKYGYSSYYNFFKIINALGLKVKIN